MTKKFSDTIPMEQKRKVLAILNERREPMQMSDLDELLNIVGKRAMEVAAEQVARSRPDK